jgi:hypothetical protein
VTLKRCEATPSWAGFDYATISAQTQPTSHPIVNNTTNSTIFCLLTPCSSEGTRRFGETYCLHLQLRRVSYAWNQHKQASFWIFGSKIHGVTIEKIDFFTVAAVRTSRVTLTKHDLSNWNKDWESLTVREAAAWRQGKVGYMGPARNGFFTIHCSFKTCKISYFMPLILRGHRKKWQFVYVPSEIWSGYLSFRAMKVTV